MNTLEEIIERAYRLFSKYQAPSPLDVCTEDCCMDKKEELLLAGSPLKEVSSYLLGEYNDGASTAKTPVDELKHFLPRYLDLINQLDFPSHSIELSLRRFKPFDEKEWTEEEKAILLEFAREYLRKILRSYPLSEYQTIDSIIIMFWKGQFDMTQLLTVWEQEEAKESILHLCDLYFHGFKDSNRTKLSNVFGEEELSEIIKNWIAHPQVKANFRTNIESLIMNEVQFSDVEDLNYVESLYDLLS